MFRASSTTVHWAFIAISILFTDWITSWPKQFLEKNTHLCIPGTDSICTAVTISAGVGGGRGRKFKRFRAFFWCSHHFLRLQRKFQKTKRKICAWTFFLLTGNSNQLNSFTRMLHLNCWFRKHPYWPPLTPYGFMTICSHFGLMAL